MAQPIGHKSLVKDNEVDLGRFLALPQLIMKGIYMVVDTSNVRGNIQLFTPQSNGG